MSSQPPLVIIMGVSGVGKTTVGKRLADSLGLSFADADDYHPKKNIDKMSQGIALTDSDRQPWLALLNKRILNHQETGLVLACSALKEDYRRQLSSSIEDRVNWVYLKGDYALIYQRMQDREDHFMSAEMLQSQFDTLEEPDNAIVFEVSDTMDRIVQNIKSVIQ